MKEVLYYIGAMLTFFVILWTGMYFASSHIEKIRVVEVEPGVKCAVTARMFNTSLDCWKTDE